MLLTIALGFTMKMGLVASKTASAKAQEGATREAHLLYSSAVYAGIAAGGALWVWLTTGVNAVDAIKTLLVLGGTLFSYQLLLSIGRPVRKFMMRNPGWTLAVMLSAIEGVRDWAWNNVLSAFLWVRLSTLIATLGFLAGAPIMGHHISNRVRPNITYTEPSLETPWIASSPRIKDSQPPQHWVRDYRLADGTEIMEYDTIIISDTHLRDPYMRAQLMDDFFRHQRFKNLVILGDFVDDEMKKEMPDHQKDILRMLRGLGVSGVHITYVPGNHDHHWEARAGGTVTLSEFLDEPPVPGEPEVPVHLAYQWVLPDGRVGYAQHGHHEDPVTKNPGNLWARLGSWAYNNLTELDVKIERQRQRDTWYSSFYFAPFGKPRENLFEQLRIPRRANRRAGRSERRLFRPHPRRRTALCRCRPGESDQQQSRSLSAAVDSPDHAGAPGSAETHACPGAGRQHRQRPEHHTLWRGRHSRARARR